MEMSVASDTDQRSVADWPRSIVPGSAVNCLAGFGGGGAGASFGGGGGGGGGGSTFFLHPAANNIKETDSNTALTFPVFILILPP
jgi:hypothetical protein